MKFLKTKYDGFINCDKIVRLALDDAYRNQICAITNDDYFVVESYPSKVEAENALACIIETLEYPMP